MTAPTRSMTFSLPPGERPLGIQQPLLSPTPLGQSLVQPKFLMPLGARSLTVLDPAINRSSDRTPALDWQSPLQESPFFDAPFDASEPRLPAPNPPINPPTLQTQSISASETFSNPSTGLPEGGSTFQPIANLEPSERDATERSIAQPLAASFFAPTIDSSTIDSPTIDAQPNSVDAFVSLSALESEASMEQFGEDMPAVLPDALTNPPSETPSPSSPASTQVFPLPEANQRHSSPTIPGETTPLSAEPSASMVEPSGQEPVPLGAAAAIAPPSPAASQPQENATSLPAPTSTTPTVAPADVPTVPSVTDTLTTDALATDALVSEASAPTIAQPATEITTASLTLPTTTEPSATPPTTTEPSVATIQLRSDAAGPSIAEPPIAEAQSPFNPSLPTETSTAASSAQTTPDMIPPDAIGSEAMKPAIDPSELEALTPSPNHVESIVQPSLAEPSTVAPIASTSQLEEALPDSLTAHSGQSEVESNRSPSDVSFKDDNLNPVSANTVRSPIQPFAMPDTPATHGIQAMPEPGNVASIVDYQVDYSLDRSGEVAETVQAKTSQDITGNDGFETGQRQDKMAFNIDEPIEDDSIAQRQIKADAVASGSTKPVDAIPTLSSQTTAIDQTFDPDVETPFRETPSTQPLPTALVESQVEQANASLDVSLPETEPANASQTASGVETQAASAPELEYRHQPDTLHQSEMPTIPVQPGGIEALTQPTMQPKAANSTPASSAAPVALSEMSTVASSQEIEAEASQAVTPPDLNTSTLPVQASGTAIDPVNVDSVNVDSVNVDSVNVDSVNVDAATAAPSVLNEPDLNEADLNEADLNAVDLNEPEREATISQSNALPALPTSIQRLSVWEPLVQLQPLAQPVDPVINQPNPTVSYPDISTNQSQPFKPQLDRPLSKEFNGFDAVLASDVVSRKAEAAPAEWSSIANLLDSIGESRDNASSPAATTATNGYADLNLHPEISTTSSNALQREPDLATIDQSAIDQPTNMPSANPSTSAEAGNQQAPSSQQQAPNASPEQFERLAQEVYRLVRQRLALERERVGTLYTGRSM